MTAQTTGDGPGRQPDHPAGRLPGVGLRLPHNFADRVTAAGYGVAWTAAGRLGEKSARALGNAAADLATRRQGPKVVQYARNLRRVLGPAATPATLHAVTKAGMRSYARYWIETFRLPAMDHLDIARRTNADALGLEHIDDAVRAGRGVVVSLPHSGNWDIAGLMIAHRHPGLMTTVVERLEPESVYRRFLAFRESLGMEILPLTGGPPVSQVLKDRLRAGHIVCLLGDRDLSSSGIEVEFFGERTRMPVGPAMLAALTGADLLAAHTRFTDDGWIADISAPLPLPGDRLAEQVRAATQLLADRYAAGIARYPADWHMLQPLWPADLEAVGRPPSAVVTGSSA